MSALRWLTEKSESRMGIITVTITAMFVAHHDWWRAFWCLIALVLLEGIMRGFIREELDRAGRE